MRTQPRSRLRRRSTAGPVRPFVGEGRPAFVVPPGPGDLQIPGGETLPLEADALDEGKGDGGEEFPAMDGQRRLEVDPDRRRLQPYVHAPDDIASLISNYDVGLRYRRPIWTSSASSSGARCASTCCSMPRRVRCTGPGSS